MLTSPNYLLDRFPGSGFSCIRFCWRVSRAECEVVLLLLSRSFWVWEKIGSHCVCVCVCFLLRLLRGCFLHGWSSVSFLRMKHTMTHVILKVCHIGVCLCGVRYVFISCVKSRWLGLTAHHLCCCVLHQRTVYTHKHTHTHTHTNTHNTHTQTHSYSRQCNNAWSQPVLKYSKYDLM
jgi:hypothetical protein